MVCRSVRAARSCNGGTVKSCTPTCAFLRLRRASLMLLLLPRPLGSRTLFRGVDFVNDGNREAGNGFCIPLACSYGEGLPVDRDGACGSGVVAVNF